MAGASINKALLSSVQNIVMAAALIKTILQVLRLDLLNQCHSLLMLQRCCMEVILLMWVKYHMKMFSSKFSEKSALGLHVYDCSWCDIPALCLRENLQWKSVNLEINVHPLGILIMSWIFIQNRWWLANSPLPGLLKPSSWEPWW